jgi:hypothetical protein
MVDRCTKPSNKAFHHYGERGIFVCDRWLSFDNWLSDMGDPPPKMTLERKDNNGPYSPDNCRWATQKDQTRNTRRTFRVEYQGQTKSLSAWCEELGLNYDSTHHKLRNLRQSPREVFNARLS